MVAAMNVVEEEGALQPRKIECAKSDSQLLSFDATKLAMI